MEKIFSTQPINGNVKQLSILLADDDTDDCNFFKETLEELPLSTHLTTVHDGEELMKYLSENLEHLPDVLFLDLNMPRKTGLECLSEINKNEKLKDIPVFVFSISYPRDAISMLFKTRAHAYIQKHSDLAQLKQSIHDALTMVVEKKPLDGQGKNL